MKGFVVAQEGHVVVPLYPVSTSGGKSCQAFSMKKYQHASIIIARGAQAAQETSVVLNACTDASGDNPTAIPFNVFHSITTAVDTLGAKTAVTASGYQPAATASMFDVIELDAQALPDGSEYVQVVIANGANADIDCVIAILSGARYAEDQSPTEIT
ncbi:MAG: hypothetical protein ACLP1Y_09420 [Candidatus Acidiferrales bacterium]